jgi:hypothetical protein
LETEASGVELLLKVSDEDRSSFRVDLVKLTKQKGVYEIR